MRAAVGKSWGRLPAAEGALDDGRRGQHQALLEGAADELHADGQPPARAARGDAGGRQVEDVTELCGAERAEGREGAAAHLDPARLFVKESGHGV